MNYAPHDDISFCQIAGRLVFLDVSSDQYFCLNSELEQAFVDCLENDGNPKADISALMSRNILTTAYAPGHHRHLNVEPPERSALEHTTSGREVRAFEFLEVFAIVCSTRIQLQARKLKEILTALVAYRENGTGRRYAPTSDLFDAASLFRRARLYVPIETSCLLDSLALAKFFIRRGLHADLVFGVTVDPFSAHCWAQAGTLVLNSTVL